MNWGKCASGRESSKYTRLAVGKLWMDIPGSDKKPD